MSVLSKKKQVFGKIAADRTLTESMPQLKTSSSFPSINNNGNVITFLSDLIKALEGYEALVESVIETISNYSEIIEVEIKNALKLELKSIVSCGINPSLPDFIKSTGPGLKITVNKIDFTNLMRIDPTSEAGELIYTDTPPNLIDSTDFNAFLYQVIQNNGSTENWGHQTGSNDILTFKFKDVDVSGIDPNNTLTIKAHQSYNNKSLSDLNNDFIDSVNLFDVAKLLTNLMNSVFGSISSIANKTITQLENEAKTNRIIDKIANSDGKDILSDKFFTFSNQEKKAFEDQAKLWQSGTLLVETSYKYASSISTSSLKNSNSAITATQTSAARKEEVKKSIEDFSNQVANQSNNIQNIIGDRKSQLNEFNDAITAFNVNKVDHKAIKLNFIQKIINNFIKTMVNTVLSPKIIAIFLINFKIIYGPTATFTDAVDFLKKNRNLVRNITKRITGIIIKILLKKALKQISKLVAESALKKQIDKNQANLAQLLSLIGVSPDVLRQIKGLI